MSGLAVLLGSVLDSLPELRLPHLADPVWLLLLAAVPGLAWRHHHGAGLGALTYSRLPTGSAGRWRLHLPFYCRLAALVLLILALARPQLGYSWEENLTEGIDIQVVLDVSGSMGAEDFEPKNRLAVAKEVVADFIRNRPGDRLGLVIFSGSAYTRAPLTTDRAMLERLVGSLELGSLADGTAIGVALATAAGRLKDSQAKSKVMVLVTDGVNNAGEIDPGAAAAVCDGLGIKVYTVGVGTEGPVPIPLSRRDPRTGRLVTRRVILEDQLDEALLRRIAERTGGQFYRATDADSLRRIFAEIDRLERTPIEIKRFVRYEEAFPPLLWGALGLMLLPLGAALLRLTAEP
jgi:Ca-activated chloride channel family protein